jgi:hypothetical protein
MTKEPSRNPIREMVERFYAKYVEPVIKYLKSLIQPKVAADAPTAPAPITYKFKFGTRDYTITKPNLDAAVSGNKITASENVSGLNKKITLSDEDGHENYYWTSQTNLSNVTTDPKISKPS